MSKTVGVDCLHHRCVALAATGSLMCAVHRDIQPFQGEKDWSLGYLRRVTDRIEYERHSVAASGGKDA